MQIFLRERRNKDKLMEQKKGQMRNILNKLYTKLSQLVKLVTGKIDVR